MKRIFTILFVLAFSAQAFANSTSTQKIEVFIDNEAEPSVFDPYADQQTTITWWQAQSSPITIEIFEDNGELVKTLTEKTDYPTGKFQMNWDGRDKYGDLVDEGDYFYEIVSDSPMYFYDKVKGNIYVNRGIEQIDTNNAPRLTRNYATKDEYDPRINEKLFIVFSLVNQADVTAEIYDKNGKEVYEMLNEKDMDPGTYSLRVENDEVSGLDGKISYRVYASNSNGFDIVEGEIDLDDESTDGTAKPNIFKDFAIDAHPYDGKGPFEVEFSLDRTAELTFEIYDDELRLEVVASNVELEQGLHNFYWNGEVNGRDIEDGIYTYKLTAENNKGKNVERGFFQVLENEDFINIQGDNCAGFNDVNKDFVYCNSIKWAKNNGIFQGYEDGTFRPNQAISRIEALKVVLEAMNVPIQPNKSAYLGFTDTNDNTWYSDYLRTGLSLGVVKGYGDNTFKPSKDVLRAEGAIIVLNTAKTVDSLVIPTYNYGQPFYDVPRDKSTDWYYNYAWMSKEHSLTASEDYFYPLNAMTRAEMADFLYRYQFSDLK